MSRNTKLTENDQKAIYNELRTRTFFARSRYAALTPLTIFEVPDGRIKGMRDQWLQSNFFRFMLEFEELTLHDLLIFASSLDLVRDKFPFLQIDRQKQYELYYGRSRPQHPLNIAKSTYSKAWITSQERDCSDFYFIIKSVFYLRYTSSLLRLQTQTYKKRLRDHIMNLNAKPLFEAIENLPDSESKNKLIKAIEDPIPGLRKKYGRRDVNLKEFYDV